MLFTSFEFIGFLLLVTVLYYTVPKKFQWVVLLAGSGVFLTGMGREAAAAVLGMVILTYVSSVWLDRSKTKGGRRHLFIVCLLFHIGFLSGYKFGVGKMPFGLSYYGLMAIAYLTGVYRRRCRTQKNIFRLAAALTFFPALVQGPINRYEDMEKIWSPHVFDSTAVSYGLARILWGYFKKLVVADRILPAVQTIMDAPEEYTGVYVFLGMIFYAVQLYADFTGGIDITLGTAKLFGIDLMENFVVPFTSKNLGEYWRRWHISLGEWIKEYVFYPLSVSRPVIAIAKRLKKRSPAVGKRFPIYLSSVCAWFVTGLWHGREAHFIVWGLANCLVILISRELKPCYDRFHRACPFLQGNGKIADFYGYFQAVRTFLLVCVLRMFDCYQEVGLTIQMFFSMFFGNGKSFSIKELFHLGIAPADYMVLFFGVILMYLAGRIKKKMPVVQWLAELPVFCRYGLILVLFFAVVVFGTYGIGYDAKQFIYNNV